MSNEYLDIEEFIQRIESSYTDRGANENLKVYELTDDFEGFKEFLKNEFKENSVDEDKVDNIWSDDIILADVYNRCFN